MPKPRSDDPRDITKTIRLTRGEADQIEKLIPPGQTFSTYARKLLLKRGR